MANNLQDMVSRIIVQLLLNENLGTPVADDDDWPIFAENYPDMDGAPLICVFQTTGEVHGRNNITGATSEHFGFQVLVRSTTQTTGFLKMNDIAIVLDTVCRAFVSVGDNDYTINAVTRRGSILPVGPEPENKDLWITTANFVVDLFYVAP